MSEVALPEGFALSGFTCLTSVTSQSGINHTRQRTSGELHIKHMHDTIGYTHATHPSLLSTCIVR